MTTVEGRIVVADSAGGAAGYASMRGSAPGLPAKRTRHLLRNVALHFALWTAIGILSVSQAYSYYRFDNRPFSLWKAIVWELPGWYLWGLLAPLIVIVARRLRPDRKNWLGRSLALFAFGMVIALGHTIFRAWCLKMRADVDYPLTSAAIAAFASWFQFEVLTCLFIVTAGYSLDFYKQYRDQRIAAAQLEKQLVQAQLQALRMQLNPHFFFNTLNAVAMLVRKRENDTAVEMISGLSDLLRYVMDQGEVQEVPLKQEVDFVEQYLDLERLRFRDRMRVHFDIAPDTREAWVPNLILQPVVENSVRHGISAKSGAGLIEIRSWRDNDRLWLQVRDDGPGLADGWERSKARGVGLSNTLSRLRRAYDSRFEFVVENADSMGAVTRIGIPFSTSPASEAQ